MQQNKTYLLTSVVLTSIFSLSAHTLILQYFHAPELNIEPNINQIGGLAIRFGTIIASIFIFLCSKEYWANLKLIWRVILFAILIMALTEGLFRNSIMQILVGTPLRYQILLTIPSYLGYLCLSLVVCILINSASKEKQFRFLRYIIIAVLATALIIWVRNLAQTSLLPLLMCMPQPDPYAIQSPYGMDILLPAYITFLEPTIASFFVFYLIRDKLLAFTTISKGLIMGGIIIAIHAGIYSIIQIICSEGNLLYRIFYYGQFLWEYLILGILTAHSFDVFQSSSQKISKSRE